MQVKNIPSSWINKNGYRFDCNPYMSGAVEARALLMSMRGMTEPLDSLTRGHSGGIYNGPVFKRRFVSSREFGVPFVTSGNMLRTDLRDVPLLSKIDAYSRKLSYLRLEEGMILISCSGAIGNMVYVRPDMEGYWSCQDQLKVSVDSSKILPGYLYSFLGSKFGMPIILGGTYGAIIQHLEPEHIENLPIPRLDPEVERLAHRLVDEAANLRSQATEKLEAISRKFDEFMPHSSRRRDCIKVSEVSSKKIQSRFDAQFHDPEVDAIKRNIQAKKSISIGDWCNSIFLPGIFKRIHIEDINYGAYYYTGASLFCLEPKPKGILSEQTSRFNEVVLKKGMILVQAFGQDGGLTGRSVWVGDHLDGQTTTHMLVRLQSSSIRKDAYLYGFLQSDIAYRQIACLTYGGSIPHFDEAGISTVLMPVFDSDAFDQIADDVLWAMEARDKALDNEVRARRLVEEAIENAAKC